MKKFISLAFILISAGFVFAQPQPTPQQKPLTQAEYVRLLYDLEKNPKKRDEVIEAVRRRGIAFVVTDGIKGLTTTKSRNDAELKRTLEEASRRRENPTASQLPSEKESAEVLAKSREATLAAVDEMPDFVVKQLVNRAASYAGTNNFTSLDRLIVAASYRSNGYEEYKVLSVNGVKQAESRGNMTYSEAGGATTTGEFVTILSSVFKPESNTTFQIIDTDVLRGRRALIYGFAITRDNLMRVVAVGEKIGDRVATGFKGKIWIDRDNFRVIRVETEATEIPASFPVKSVKRYIDYDWVNIGSEKYLLPLVSEVRFVQKSGGELYESRNIIRFKEYQKFGSEVKILDTDDEEVPEEKPMN